MYEFCQCLTTYASFLLGSATLDDLLKDHSGTLENLCLNLDIDRQWKALATKCSKYFTTETLQRIETPFSFTEAVLQLLKTKNPGLPLKTIRGVLKNLKRNDVCKELECFSGIISASLSNT